MHIAGTALVMVTHNQALAKRCDRMLILIMSCASLAAPLCIIAIQSSHARRSIARGCYGPATTSSAVGRFHRCHGTDGSRRFDNAFHSAPEGGGSPSWKSTSAFGFQWSLRRTDQRGTDGIHWYRGTIAVENLDVLQSLYLLPLDVQIYVQQGNRWKLCGHLERRMPRELRSCVNLKVCSLNCASCPRSSRNWFRATSMFVSMSPMPSPMVLILNRILWSDGTPFFVYLLPIKPDAENGLVPEQLSWGSTTVHSNASPLTNY